MQIEKIKETARAILICALLGSVIAVVFSLTDFLGTIFWSSRTDRFLNVYLRLPDVRYILVCLTLRLAETFAILGGIVGIGAGILLQFAPKHTTPSVGSKVP